MKVTSSESIQQEIVGHFGFYPPIFEPAKDTSDILESLWDQYETAYIRNPIPSMFKEKLSALLGRFNRNSYLMVCHSSNLRHMGMSSNGILSLLEQPPLNYVELSERIKCEGISQLEAWPESGSEAEECLLYCSVAIFINLDADQCTKRLQQLLCPNLYEHLILFISHIKSYHSWAEGHPEMSYEKDERFQKYLKPTLKNNPRLLDFFENYQSKTNFTKEGKYDEFMERERKFRPSDILESIKDGFLCLDKNWRINYANKVTEKLTGLDQSELIGKTFWKIYPESIGTKLEDCLRTALLKNKEVTLDYRDNKLGRWFNIRVYPSGSIGLSISFKDINEEKIKHKILVAREEQLSAFFEMSDKGLIIILPDGTISRINNTISELLGYETDSYVGKNVFDFVYPPDTLMCLDVIRRLESGEINKFTVEKRYLKKDKTILWSKTTLKAIRDKEGKLTHILEFLEDIRSTKEIQDQNDILAIRTDHERSIFQDLLMQIPVSISIMSGEKHAYAFTNPSHLRLIGKKDLQGKILKDVLPELESQGVIELLDDVYSTGKPFVANEIHLQLHKHGAIQNIYANLTIQPFKGADGKIEGVIVVIIDVTDMVRIRQKLQEDKERFRTTFSMAPVGVSLASPDGHLLTTNPAFSKITGYSEEELLNTNLRSLIPIEDLESYDNCMRLLMKEGNETSVSERRIIKKTSELIWIQNSISVSRNAKGNVTGIIIVTEDITQRVKDRERLMFTLNAGEMGNWEYDAVSNTLKRSFKYDQIFGYDNIVPNWTFDKFIHHVIPEDRELVFKTFHETKGAANIDIEFRLKRTDGAIRWVSLKGKTEVNSEGVALKAAGVISDITESVQGREWAKTQQRWLEEVLDQLPNALCMVEPVSARILFTNKAAGKLKDGPLNKKFSRKEVARMFKLYDKDGKLLTEDGLPLVRVARGEKLKDFELQWECDGEKRYYNINSEVMAEMYGHSETILLSYQDVTMIKEIQANLKTTVDNLQTEKDLRERFVATLSHDLRNPMAAAKMSAELISRQKNDHEKVVLISKKIMNYIERAEQMISDLLDANRIQAGEGLILHMEETNLSAIIASAVDDLTAVYGDRFNLSVKDNVIGIWNEKSLRRVVDNLITNALKYGSHDKPVSISLKEKGNKIIFCIHNFGNPMNEQEVKTIFYPFKRVTTAAKKTNQKGWGLGLTLVKGTIASHQGDIKVSSNEKEGTTFTFTLPRVSKSSA